MKKVLLMLGLFVLTVGAGPYYLLKYTTAPFRALAYFAGKLGVEMNGFSGDLSRGFGIDTIRYAKDENEFEFNKIVINYASIANQVGVESIRIDEVSMDGFKVLIRKLPASDGRKAEGAQVQNQRKRTFRDVFANKVKSIVYAKVSIKNGEILLPGMKESLKLQNYEIRNLALSAQGASVESFVFGTDQAELALRGVSFSEEGAISMNEEGRLTLKQGFSPALKKDWVAGFKLSMEPSGAPIPKVAGYVKAFGERLKLGVDEGGKMEMKVEGLNLEDWFHVSSNMSALDLDFSTPAPAAIFMGNFQLAGKIKVGEQTLALRSAPVAGAMVPKLWAQEERYGIQLVADLNRYIEDFRGAFKNASAENGAAVPVRLELRSTRGDSDGDALALFFYGKPSRKLSKVQRQKLPDLKGALGLSAGGMANRMPSSK